MANLLLRLHSSCKVTASGLAILSLVILGSRREAFGMSEDKIAIGEIPNFVRPKYLECCKASE